MIARFKARLIGNSYAQRLKDIDQAYVQGAKNEREKIMAVLDDLIEKNRGMDSWTALLRQARNSIGNQHGN